MPIVSSLTFWLCESKKKKKKEIPNILSEDLSIFGRLFPQGMSFWHEGPERKTSADSKSHRTPDTVSMTYVSPLKNFL